MSSPDTALLVVDVQESFRHRPYFDSADVPSFLERIQALVDGASAVRIPVVQIFHVEPAGAFSEASGHVRAFEPLAISPSVTFRKARHSAFVGTGLQAWLARHEIRRLIMSGIRTEQCCETSTRHGSDLGYEIDFVSEAMLTFPMSDRAGHKWTPAEIRARTELVLADRFARIATVDEALSAARGRRAD